MAKIPFHTFFGQCVAKKRHALKIPQTKLAEMVGISARHCCDIEAGRINLHIDTMLAIIEVLNLSVDELITQYQQQSK